MPRCLPTRFMFCSMAICSSAFAAGTVNLNLLSPQDGQTLAPGQLVQWRIEAEVSTGDNAGLALILVNLEQSPLNAALIDIPLADGVPPQLAAFDAPAGFANNPIGYRGLRVGPVGARNLEQIGGAQNTFGVAAATMGQDIDVDPGLGQSGPLLIAEGSFRAPFVEGGYQFNLADPLANTLVTVNSPPMQSPTESAFALFGSSSFSFSVDPALSISGDMNCDGVVNSDDADAFALAAVAPTEYQATYPDCNADEGDVNNDGLLDGRDIQGFVQCLIAGSCP